MPFRRTCVVAVAMLSFVGSITLGIRAADAGDSPEQLTISVDRPTPGATISVSGQNCFGFKVLLFLTKHHILLLDSDAVVPDEGGSWSGSLTIPAREELVGKTLTISAKCLGDNTEYLPAQIVVVPEEETPPPTVPPTTPPTPPPGDGGGTPPGGDGGGAPGAPAGQGTGQTGGQQTTGRGTMPPARAVDGEPTFTG